ncbi:MAG TPA: GMC family oxidoreductase, partial [Rhodothermales bacterium]|nr:GMC family oxidoreductase [Rhodothermales bacterium]
GGWTLEGEPYTNDPGTEWRWYRARMLGGRTNHWGRISLRFGPYDFKAKSRDGLGEDWPITYDEIKPYYDKLDRLVGLFGSNEGLYNEPDGIFMPAPKPRCYELLIKQACDKINIPVVANRLSVITQPLNGRPACHYCSQCGRGCGTYSNFSSPPVLIKPALETGKLTLIPNAMAREVTTDSSGMATGVSYVNKEDRQEYQIRARVVVLAASACESARLLLNSKSSLFPQGLANSSGVVGKYITDSLGTDVAGLVPSLMDGVPHNEDGTGGAHIYVPWWLYGKQLDFPRGYHIEIWGGRRMPGFGFGGGIQGYNGKFPDQAGSLRELGGGGYGAQLKDDYRRFYGSVVGFAGRGEMIAREDNYMEIDSRRVDQWGIPVPRFHVTWSDHEYNQVKHMQETFREIVDAMGGTPLSPMPTKEDGYDISTPGSIIHETGGTRMGDDPKTSALNRYCQAHEVKNLFVADGGPFVSQAHKNPTWTILALSMRTSEYLADQMKKRNI